ncbi:MAG: zinc ribbon domain-containing protein, partial [Desulfobacterales bacterium]
CSVCGLHQAYFQRIDHYFNLFFIPLFRLKKGAPFIMCERCQTTVHEFGEDVSRFRRKTDQRCSNCGKPVEKKFRFCPFCGKRV